MVRRGAFLAPVSPFDAESLEMLPGMKELSVRVSQGRSVPRLRLYFAMLGLVCQNLDQPVTPDALHQWLKLKCGYCDEIKLRSGEIVSVPASVAFDKMSEADFAAYFDSATALLVEHVIPGLKSGALIKEAQAMLGGS